VEQLQQRGYHQPIPPPATTTVNPTAALRQDAWLADDEFSALLNDVDAFNGGMAAVVELCCASPRASSSGPSLGARAPSS
jgi:hypothetical protein